MKTKQEINIIWFGILMALIAISAPWFDLSVSNHSFIKTYIAGIGTSFLLIIAVFINYKNQTITWHISYLKLLFLIVFSLGTLSIFWSTNTDFTVTKWLIWFTIFAAFIAAYNIEQKYDNLIKFCYWMLVAASIVSIIGILQYLFDPFALTQAVSPASTFGNKNMSTQPLVLIFPLSLFLLFSPKITKHNSWLVAIAISLTLVFDIYTTTRSSWIAIFAEIALIVIFLIFKRKSLKEWISWDTNKTYASIGAGIIFIILINLSADGWNPYWNTFYSTVKEIGDSANNNQSIRYLSWNVAREMIADSPLFGTGLGSWFHNEVQGNYGTWKIQYLQRVHNDVLEMAIEIGLIGVLFFIAAIVATIIAVWKIIIAEKQNLAWFYFLLFVSLSGSFINMQFSFPYQLAMPATILGFYLGLIAKKSENFVKPIQQIKFNFSKNLIKKYKQTLLFLTTLLFIIVSSIYISWINAYSALNQLNLHRDFDRLYLVKTPIYHLEMQNILNFLATAYMRTNNDKKSLKIVNQSLKYWDKDSLALYRKAKLLNNLGRTQEGLIVVKKSKKYMNKDSYKAHIMELKIYQKMKNKQAFIKAYKELANKPENSLMLEKNNYNFLLSFSLFYPELYKFAPQIYKQYNKYNKYNCGVENNIAVYYIRVKDYKNAKRIYNENKDKNCLNSNLVKKIKNL